MAQQSVSAASRHTKSACHHVTSVKHHASLTTTQIVSLQPYITAVEKELMKVVLIENFEAILAIV
jgi:hypothetical protein